MIQLLKDGLVALRLHSRLWLIIWLIIIFPGVFLYSILAVGEASRANVATIERGQVAALHDSLEGMVAGSDLDGLQLFLDTLRQRQPTITALQILESSPEGFLVLASLDGETVGTYFVDNPSALRTALIEPGESYLYPYVFGGQNIIRGYRAVGSGDQPLFIYTEHNFSPLSQLFASRVQNAYLALSLAFCSIIFLAYWLIRQINYEALYHKAQKTIAERELFTNSLAHELRAPLTAMRGYASMIEESPDTPQTERAYAHKIADSTARLVGLVNDFLEAARVQSGKLALTYAPVSVASVVAKVASEAEVLARAKNLTLTTTLPALFEIETDQKRLEQVLMNILSNAIKYTKEGTISLRVEQGVAYTKFVIADTGHGISAEDQRKLFTPFTRVGEAAETAGITGTGLGMWITKQLIEQMGGTIELESIKGVGTHIKISLPHKKTIP